MENHIVCLCFVLVLCATTSQSTRVTDILCTNDAFADPQHKLVCDSNFKYEMDRRYHSCFKEIFTDANGANDITLLETRDCRGAALDPRIPEVFKNLFQYSISWHGIESLTPDDLRFNGLKIFDASHNKLTNISAGLFIQAPRLWDIDLSFNCIETVEPGAFSELNELYVLKLTNNPIRRYDGKIFLPIDFQVNSMYISWENVEEFDISGMNGMYDFSFGNATNGLPHRLAIQKETKTSAAWTLTLRYVSEANFENVKIFNVSGTAVGNIMNVIGILGPKLEKLDVSSISIGHLNGTLFDRFSHLQYLNVSNTNLTSIDFSGYENRAKLQVLDISQNQNLNGSDSGLSNEIFGNLEKLNLVGNNVIY